MLSGANRVKSVKKWSRCWVEINLRKGRKANGNEGGWKIGVVPSRRGRICSLAFTLPRKEALKERGVQNALIRGYLQSSLSGPCLADYPHK